MPDDKGTVTIQGQTFSKDVSDEDIAFILNRAAPSHAQGQRLGAGAAQALAPLGQPGAGVLGPGIGAVGNVMSLGMMSPAPKSVEQVAVEGGAAIAAMMTGGLGAAATERLAGPLIARAVSSGATPEMASLIIRPLTRTVGAFGGGYTGSLGYSGVTAAAGLEGSPASMSEAFGRAESAGKLQAGIQLGAELIIPPVARMVSGTYGQAEKAALASPMTQKVKKLEALNLQRADHLKRVNIAEIKEATAKELASVTQEVVSEMGQARAPEQLAQLGSTIDTRVTAALNRRMTEPYKALDQVAQASNVTVNGSHIGDQILAIAKAEPRGEGIARPFTKPTSRFSEIVEAAKTGQTEKLTEEITTGERYPKPKGKPPKILPAEGIPTPQGDLVEAFRTVLDPAVNKSIRLDAMLKARGTISREIANAATDEETRSLLTKILKPWDDSIKGGLSKINPELGTKWDIARDLWHKGSIVRDRVLLERLSNAGAKSLTTEIQPNAPRNVEQIRLLLNEAFPKVEADVQWRALQRAKIEELIGTDLAGFSRRYKDYGNTMKRLFQTPEEQAVANRLTSLSDEFAHMQQTPSIQNDQKLRALDAAIGVLETGGEKNAVAKMAEFLFRPHIAMYGAAGALGGAVYGPVGIAGALASAGIAESAGKKLIPAIVRAAEKPAEGNRLLIALRNWKTTNSPANAANLARALSAAYKLAETEADIEMAVSH